MDDHMGLLLGCFIVVSLIFTVLLMAFYYMNRANILEIEARAQQKNNETIYDTAWKIIQGQAGVASAYRDAFQTVFHSIMTARYNSNDELMRWIQERNPHFDSSLFTRVSDSIDSQRSQFQACQKRLISIQQEHNNLRLTIPGCWFVGGRPEIRIQIVTSERTNAAFQTGLEDTGIDPFKSAAPAVTLSYGNNGAVPDPSRSNGVTHSPSTPSTTARS